MKSLHNTVGYNYLSVGLFLIFCLLFNIHASSQSRSELEERRTHLYDEIKKTDKLLKSTESKKKKTLSSYYALQKQIEHRQELINTLQQELQYNNQSIERAETVIEALTSDFDRLKSEYAHMARNAYRINLKHNKLAFLFSSSSMNEAFKRWKYLSQYESYRNRQARLIYETQQMLEEKANKLHEKKKEKEDSLLFEISQKNLLHSELDKKNNLIAYLQQDENKLKEDLDTKRRAHERLGRAIENVILKELARADLNERRNSTKKIPASANSTKSIQGLSTDFSNNKKRLPWPVKHGVITGKYGNQNHPALKRIQISNNGIDIQTSENENVYAVFEGTVAGIQFIPGNNYMLILKHGNYFTVYSNLEKVHVSTGQQINRGQAVGIVGFDRISNQYELHFEIWMGKDRKDPSHWLVNR